MNRIFHRTMAAALSALLLATSASALSAEDTLKLLDENYLGAIPASVRTLETAEEILSALGDPYTVYLPKQDYEEFLGTVNGNTVVGIGVQVHQIQGKGIEIISILPDSPALDQGLVAGDCILSVDGTAPTSLDHASELIGGEAGTTVSLTVRHANGTRQNYTFTRRAVLIPIVTSEDVEGVPFITCSSFGSTTPTVIRETLEDYLDWDGSFVLDLRNNPGGTDTAAAGSAGWFVGGQIISYYLDNLGNQSYIYTLSITPDYTDAPLIILTSGYSASGSEMFAGAIRDLDAGIAIGSRTYGKGVAQHVFDQETHPDLFDGDSIKITTSRFYSPDGGTNDIVGIIPALTINPDYVEDVAFLLSSPAPADPEDALRLYIGENNLYIDLDTATSTQYRPAFEELLSALPITMPIASYHNGHWIPLDVAILADDLNLTVESRQYPDVASSPYINQLSELAVHGILPVDEDGLFHPDDILSRGDFAYQLAYALQLHIVDSNPFPDVTADDPNAQAIAALYAKGLVAGDEHGNFNPNSPITAQEVTTILATTAQWLSLEAHNAKVAGFDAETLASFGGYATWAQTPAAILDAIGALHHSAAPTDTVQRDLGATMIYKMMDGCHLLWN